MRHFFAQNYVYVWGNVIWVVFTLLIIPAPAAWAGLTWMSYHAHRHPSPELGLVWQGIKQYFWKTLPFSIIGIVVVVINVSNLMVYRESSDGGVNVLRVFWAAILGIWFAVQLYAFPLLHAMKTPTLLGAYRNTGVMMLQNPLFTLGIWGVAAGVIAFSVFFGFIPFLLITGGALAAIGNTAVQNRLRAAGIEPTPSEPDSIEPDIYWDGVS